MGKKDSLRGLKPLKRGRLGIPAEILFAVRFEKLTQVYTLKIQPSLRKALKFMGPEWVRPTLLEALLELTGGELR